MTGRGALLVAALAGVLLAGACARSAEPSPAAERSGRLEAGGVTVEAVLADGQVRATFRPQRPGFHVYSIDLPPDGVQGLGIPTVVAVRGSLDAIGTPSADKPVNELRIEELNVTLPVYPDGPVTVTLPIRSTADGPAEVVVTYGACSASTCLPPVRERVIALA
ncbi:protein-disulfide reductase DsbD domain-containing protein [Micromonospora rhizosphaerae]|uniref:protein-disulfide reductase DsbD domain-containing protein n=1 Tax=Micromonospora rhizosphaerae TaxID=568872 RepID=UPI00159EF84B|nr:protein-disulfide reductase DsbD domain-containing protein [Micromonospora rhizosphaerae]